MLHNITIIFSRLPISKMDLGGAKDAVVTSSDQFRGYAVFRFCSFTPFALFLIFSHYFTI